MIVRAVCGLAGLLTVASPSAPPPGGAGIGASISTDVGTGGAGARFAACMRAQAAANFPDPDSKGTITLTVSQSLNPSSPLFQKALVACRHLLPPGHALSRSQQQRVRQGALVFAACMRSHGVPHYPDPTFSNGGITQGFSPRSGTDSSTRIFQEAQKTCQTQRMQQP